jgi:hypothetical protein
MDGESGLVLPQNFSDAIAAIVGGSGSGWEFF